MLQITEDVVKVLVDQGLEKGIIETDFGEAVVAKALVRGIAVYTITFPDVEEKWAIINGDAVGVKYNKLDMVKETPTESTKEPPVEDVREGPRKRRVLTPKAKPMVDRPRTNDARDKKKGIVTEKEPTVRARMGRPVEKNGKMYIAKTPDIKGQGSRAEIKIPVVAVVDKKTGKVPRIGPKVPVWQRQMGWNSKPEKVDVNLYPHKIVCKECGQPRYIDGMNYGVKSHPVTMCKPCALAHNYKEHNRRVRERDRARTIERRRVAQEMTNKAPERPQEPRKSQKAGTIPSKGVKAVTKPSKNSKTVRG